MLEGAHFWLECLSKLQLENVPLTATRCVFCAQMHTSTFDIGLEITYANARNGVWEPVLEPCEVRRRYGAVRGEAEVPCG